jgi:hypothetical protein
LEIKSVWDYWRKKWIYGQVNHANRALGSRAALSRSDRLKLFNRAVRRGDHGLAVSGVFFVALMIGAICFELGRIANNRSFSHRLHMSATDHEPLANDTPQPTNS